ncbi:MAG: hypothetical protein NC412_12000 [Roseburia sp.]|nr:hypothetical protein [Roseburia sp.]MCM1279078.1 hypothetical protein [Robinsoniella sp.]
MKKKKGSRKIVAVVLTGVFVFLIMIRAEAYSSSIAFNGGTMSYTCTVAGTLGKSKTSSAVASTGYDVAGYIQTIGAFGYDSGSSAISSGYQESVATASTVTSTKTGVTSYKAVHSILDSSRSVLKTVKKTIQ